MFDNLDLELGELRPKSGEVCDALADVDLAAATGATVTVAFEPLPDEQEDICQVQVDGEAAVLLVFRRDPSLVSFYEGEYGPYTFDSDNVGLSARQQQAYVVVGDVVAAAFFEGGGLQVAPDTILRAILPAIEAQT